MRAFMEASKIIADASLQEIEFKESSNRMVLERLQALSEKCDDGTDKEYIQQFVDNVEKRITQTAESKKGMLMMKTFSGLILDGN